VVVFSGVLLEVSAYLPRGARPGQGSRMRASLTNRSVYRRRAFEG